MEPAVTARMTQGPCCIQRQDFDLEEPSAQVNVSSGISLVTGPLAPLPVLDNAMRTFLLTADGRTAEHWRQECIDARDSLARHPSYLTRSLR